MFPPVSTSLHNGRTDGRTDGGEPFQTTPPTFE